MKKAEQALAVSSERELLSAWHTRYNKTQAFITALRDFDGCQYWRESGAASLQEYGAKAVQGSDAREWRGWLLLLRCPDSPDICSLISKRKLKIERLVALKAVLDRYNYRTWLFLAVHLRFKELLEAATEWNTLAETGMKGNAIFVPLWLPEKNHREIFGNEGQRRIPAWERLKAHLKKKTEG